MADKMSKEDRSRTMSKIRSKDTGIEIEFRKILWNGGFRYRIHPKLPGKPDIVFPSKKIAVFIDGCFWHKCPKCYKEPKSNKEYWLPKIEKNAERDSLNTAKLENMGWVVMRFWEHEINEDVNKCTEKVAEVLEKPN